MIAERARTSPADFSFRSKEAWRLCADLEGQQLGLETQSRLIARINPALAGYTPDRLPVLYRELEDRFSRIPGVRSALAPIVAGLLIGIPVAFGGGRAIANQLFGVKAYNPLVFGAAILTLISAAILAALIPALRASSIDPQKALKSE
jgi:hypothetical protein